MKKEINVEELKQIQLDILKFVDKFCKENNLKYSCERNRGYL